MSNPSTPANLAQRPAPRKTEPPKRFQRQFDPLYQSLRFAPLAWLKLRLFLHAGDTEVGFFGISDEDDLLYVQDIVALKQHVTAVSVQFEDNAVADYFDHCADAGISPSRCGRVWIHTHPGDSPEPSTVDEETFARVFGNCDWAIMAIIARGGASYARLTFTAGPGGSVLIPIRVDWEQLPDEFMTREGTLDTLITGWMDEYATSIFPEDLWPAKLPASTPSAHLDRPDMLDELYDRQFLDERIDDLYLDTMREEVFHDLHR